MNGFLVVIFITWGENTVLRDFCLHLITHYYSTWPALAAREAEEMSIYMTRHIAAPNKIGGLFMKKKGRMDIESIIRRICYKRGLIFLVINKPSVYFRHTSNKLTME